MVSAPGAGKCGSKRCGVGELRKGGDRALGLLLKGLSPGPCGGSLNWADGPRISAELGERSNLYLHEVPGHAGEQVPAQQRELTILICQIGDTLSFKLQRREGL